MPDLTRRAAICTAAALAVPPAALAMPAIAAPFRPAGETPLFGATQWTLPNGLRVVHVDSRRVPVVAHYLFYAAGAGDDPAGRSGLAHFLEHMMFKGSARVAPGAFSLAVAREGGQDNAFTSREVTAYHQHVEASRLPLVMRMEADRFAGPLLPEETLEPERAVVLEERRLRTDSNPRTRFHEIFDAALWGDQHWRGRPVIGWEPEIRAISRADMQAFYASRYAPANAVLVVAGDVREAELRRLVDEFYAPVPARPAQPRQRAAAPATAVESRVVRHDAGVREASFSRAYMAPSHTTGATAQAYPLEVLAHVLGGGQGSLLYRALVEPGHATTASAWYDGDSAGIGEFGINATPRPGVTPEQLESALDATLARVLDQGLAEDQVARSIRQTTAGALLALDGIGAAPRLLGGALALGLPIEEIEFWPARIRAVTPAQVTEAARAVLGAAPRTTGWLLPGQA